MDPAANVRSAFVRRFGGAPRLFQAPGRINIIGEHTDYSGGFVMPAAIDRTCILGVARNDLGSLRVISLNRNTEVELPSTFSKRNDWTDYVGGIRAALAEAGIDTPGCDLVLHSDVPEGAGVSSSAALEVSVLIALLAMADVSASPLDIARWAQNAESRYVGVPCGIMDQFIAVHGQKGRALLLDCRSLDFEAVAVPESFALVLFDSNVRHRLVDGGYAARRADCEEAANRLDLPALRDAQPDQLGALSERLQRRARHVVSENARVQQMAQALSDKDLIRAGALLSQSHESLRRDFDVTCPETDTLAEIASNTPGVFGARQMGGGFGGMVLTLTTPDTLLQACDEIAARYKDATGFYNAPIIVRIGDGAGEMCV